MLNREWLTLGHVLEMPSSDIYSCVSVLSVSLISDFEMLRILTLITDINEAKYAVHMNTRMSWIPDQVVMLTISFRL